MLYLHDDSGEEIDSDGLPFAVSTGGEDPTADTTASGLGRDEIFHLLGNPYDAAFDLGSLAGGDLPGAGFQATVQIWDPAQGNYVQITQGDASDNLPAWQGFFVERTSAGSGQKSLTFAASGKQSGDGSLIGSNSASPLLAGGESDASAPASAPASAKAADQHAEVALTLSLAGTDGAGTPPSPSSRKAASASKKAVSASTARTDRAVYWVDDRAASGYDAYEAKDLAPPSEKHVRLAFPLDRSGTLVRRAQGAAPYPSSPIDRTVPLAVRGVGTGGTATITWPDSLESQAPDQWIVRLRDTQADSTVSLRREDYTFELAEGGSLASPSDARFRLELQDSTIPVELASFGGAATEEGVRLTWRTAGETNNAGFRVLRRGGGAWTEVGFVEGSGTTSEARSYRFTDGDLPYAADSVSYRLKQVDTDGTTRLTDPVTVARAGPDGLELLGTYPNPARRQVTVRYGVPESVEGEVRLRLYDVLGREVRAVGVRAEAGRHEQTLDVRGLSSGMYVLRLTADGQAKTRKLMVVR